MDRKNKIWLIVLAVLLAVAIVVVFIINGDLTSSKQTLEAMSTQLASEQENYQALNTQLEDVSAQLAQEQEKYAALETELSEVQEKTAALETELASANEQLTAANEQLTAANEQLSTASADKTALESQLSEAQTQTQQLTADQQTAQYTIATMEEAADAYRARIQELEVYSAEAEGKIAELNQAIATAETRIAELTGETAPESAASVGVIGGADGPTAIFVAGNGSAEAAELEAAIAAAAEEIAGMQDAEAVKTAISEKSAEFFAAYGEAAEVSAEALEAALTSAVEVVVTEAPVAVNGETVMIVPEVSTPTALANPEAVNIDEIYTSIDTIVNAEEGALTDEQKVQELDTLKAELAGYVEELNVALEEIAVQEAALAASAQSISALESELATAQTKVDELIASIAAGEATIEGLQAEIAALNEQSAADSAEAAAQIEALNAQIIGVQTQVESLTVELNAANMELSVVNAELEKRLAELEAYKLERELSDGEAHAASTLENTLLVDGDGACAHWNFTNTTISGNAVVLTITLDGEEIYKSEALKPGETVTEFELTRALEAGSYEAIAVTSVYDADGNYMSATRVPVAIQVGQ